MSGRSPSEAVQNFVGPLQLALSCVTDSVLRPLSGGYSPGGNRGLVLNRNEPVPLNGPRRLQMFVAQQYEIVEIAGERGPWKISTRAYQYHVTKMDGSEIILFHWHPSSRIVQPHLHLGRSTLDPDGVLSRTSHVPTGRISLEQVITLLIDEFQVVPRRTDCQEVLASGLANFRQWSSWA